MALSGLPGLKRLLSKCRGSSWLAVRHQSSQQAAEESREKPDLSSPSSQTNILVPLDSENSPDVHVTHAGQIYDRERLARDVSRMYPHHRAKMLHVNTQPEVLFEHQKTKAYLRKAYAKYGKDSGVDPGVMWPTREEIGLMTAAERDLGIPTLQESWARVKAKRTEKEDEFKMKFDQVDANMAKMDDEIKAFRKRQRQAADAVLAEKVKREKLMEEAKELLGFQVDPRDKRFQELVDAKEAAMKKQMKATKKKEREAKVVARLTTVAESDGAS